ncbi:MAG: hypothetical protein ABJH38_11140, partial [Lentilitoribacter sp.]
NVGTKADLGDAIVYLEALRSRVLAGVKKDKTVGQLQESVTMGEYKDWLGYENWREDNVQAMAEYLIKAEPKN